MPKNHLCDRFRIVKSPKRIWRTYSSKKMFIKHIFLSCLIYYYTPTVNSMDKVEIQILWDTIRDDSDFIDYNHLHSYYKSEDPDELSSVIQSYGHKYKPSKYQSKVEYKMTFKEFTKAASEGRIQICSTQAMYTVFKEIIPKQETQVETETETLLPRQNSIILEDMINYYGPIVSASQLKHVIKKYGKSQGAQHELKFNEFQKAINIGDLPKPLHDQVAIIMEIEYLFNEIKCKLSDYVTLANMCTFYPRLDEFEFREVMKTYGSGQFVQASYEYGEYRMNNAEFLLAGFAGYIPRFSDELIKTAFIKIIPEKENGEYITFEKFDKYYKKMIPASQLEYIKINFGKIQDGQYLLDFYGFKRVMNSGYLPEPLHDKIPEIYTLFKEIIPKTENRNHIIFADIIKYYGIEESKKLRRIFSKHGDWIVNFDTVQDPTDFDSEWDGQQYLLKFPNFKRVMNFGELSLP